MKSTRTYRNLQRQTLALALGYVLLSWAGLRFFSPSWVLPVTTALLLVAVSWRLFRALHRQIGEQQFAEFRQLEALAGLYDTLDIHHPLPRMRHTAASPDFLHLLATEIFRRQPEIVVEVGSGTSTLVAAYCLKKLGRGRLVSLDHLARYADATRESLRAHGLGEFASVVHAPLRDYELDGASYSWYDDAALGDIDGIDLLIVDGPPQEVSSWARYPALPLLRERLAPAACVLLDDGARKDETAIVEAWRQRYGIAFDAVQTEKGAFVGQLEPGDDQAG